MFLGSSGDWLLVLVVLVAIRKKHSEMKEINLLKEIVNRTNGFGCTTFALKDDNQIVFGRNFDFMIDYGHIIVNKRNVSKTALVPPSEKQLKWTSKVGSITFNQAGREFPYGGINESGLVIEQLWFDSTQYPKSDSRYGISVLQWIQYQLDVSENINDVIKSDLTVRIIDDSGAALHFFLTDKNGDSACIEFIEGEMKVRKGKTLNVSVLTNNSYSKSMEHLDNPKKEENNQNIFTGSSLQRFEQAAKLVNQYSQANSLDIIEYSFKILDKVKQLNFTQWSIVYDISNLEIYFKTKSNSKVLKIQMKSLDFSSTTPCMILDLATSKNSVNFEKYSIDKNFDLINQVFDSLDMLKDVPMEMRAYSANYPNTTIFNDEKEKSK